MNWKTGSSEASHQGQPTDQEGLTKPPHVATTKEWNESSLTILSLGNWLRVSRLCNTKIPVGCWLQCLVKSQMHICIHNVSYEPFSCTVWSTKKSACSNEGKTLHCLNGTLQVLSDNLFIKLEKVQCQVMQIYLWSSTASVWNLKKKKRLLLKKMFLYKQAFIFKCHTYNLKLLTVVFQCKEYNTRRCIYTWEYNVKAPQNCPLYT